MWLEVKVWTCHITVSSVISLKSLIKNINDILMWSRIPCFGFLIVNKLGCGLLSSKLRKDFKSASVFVVWPDPEPEPGLEFLHADVIKRILPWSGRGAHLRLGAEFRPGVSASAVKSGKQITPWPISQLHVRHQPLGRETLDSGPVLPARCRAADDKVRLHNDVTYL